MTTPPNAPAELQTHTPSGADRPSRAPYRVAQTYWRWSHLPRYLVLGPGGQALHTRPTLHRPCGTTRTWKREAEAQAVADEWNQRAAESAAECAARKGT